MLDALILTLALTGGATAGAPLLAAPPESGSRQDRMIREEIEEFLEEVEEYLEHRRKAREGLP